jgi:hypothetical protein
MLDAVFDFLVRVVGGVIFHAVFYWPGWLMLRVLTFGRYPPAGPDRHNEAFVAVMGFALILCVVGIPLSLRAGYA